MKASTEISLGNGLFKMVISGAIVRAGPATQKVIWRVLSAFMFIASASCNASTITEPTSTDLPGPREEVITTVITVQVTEDVARTLHKRSPPTAESKDLLRIVEMFELTLEPMHPGTDDPNLQSYFIVKVADNANAQQIIGSLRHSEGVVAAYVKPPDELP